MDYVYSILGQMFDASDFKCCTYMYIHFPYMPCPFGCLTSLWTGMCTFSAYPDGVLMSHSYHSSVTGHSLTVQTDVWEFLKCLDRSLNCLDMCIIIIIISVDSWKDVQTPKDIWKICPNGCMDIQTCLWTCSRCPEKCLTSRWFSRWKTGYPYLC